MLKLYYAPQTRSTRPRAVLEELGVPYELVRLDLSKGEHKTPEHLAIHPMGKVPALQDGDTIIFESVAICMYLADKFLKQGLAPSPHSPLRGVYYQWLLFAASTLEPLIGTVFVNTVRQPENKDLPSTKEAQQSFAQCAATIESALQNKEFFVGDSFTVVDIVMGSMLAWARAIKLLEGYPNIAAYISRVGSRPSFQAARKD
jgi:glutathione S-transferase